jgi:enamine deaminase RidA (YjgF/YER057c/UK114 family)
MMVPDADVTDIFSNEFIEQRKAYLQQADAVARELGKLTSASVRTLGYLTEMEPDAKLLDTVQRKANEILVLQRQLRDLWWPHLAS